MKYIFELNGKSIEIELTPQNYHNWKDQNDRISLLIAEAMKINKERLLEKGEWPPNDNI